MVNLVIIKVKIGLRFNKSRNEAEYPDFNAIQSQVNDWPDRLDWSYYVDRFGGWHYDKQCGHQDEDATSPRGMQWGMLCVPEQFAKAAVTAFPDSVSVIDEAEAEDFYENRCTAHLPEVKDDVEVLQAIAARNQLNRAAPEDEQALDPEHPSMGRRRNKTKKWAGLKKQRGDHN